jgi:protein transport protein SEC23
MPKPIGHFLIYLGGHRQPRNSRSGLIGHAISTGKKSARVGETEIGIGQTLARKINADTPRTSTAVYFDVVTPAGQPLQPGSRARS